MNKVAQKDFWLVWTCDKPSVALELSTWPCRKILDNEYWRSWTHHPQERTVRDVETMPYGQMSFPKAVDIASVSKSTFATRGGGTLELLENSRPLHMPAALHTMSLHSSCSAAAAHAVASASQCALAPLVMASQSLLQHKRRYTRCAPEATHWKPGRRVRAYARTRFWFGDARSPGGKSPTWHSGVCSQRHTRSLCAH